MKLSTPILKDLIQQVYLEAFEDLINDPELDLPPLPAEPSSSNEDPPDIITEQLTPAQKSKIEKLLSMLSAEDRAFIFRKYGYYTTKNLLLQLNQMKRAEKGEL